MNEKAHIFIIAHHSDGVRLQASDMGLQIDLTRVIECEDVPPTDLLLTSYG